MEEPPARTPVLIAGGGPSGLSASIELGRRGIENVVVEPRMHVSHTNPRAKLTNIRTMEHFRRWGIAEALRERCPLPIGWSEDVVFSRTVLDEEIVRFTEAFGAVPGRPDRYAEQPLQIPQYLVEEELRERVESMDAASLHTGWRVESVQQDDEGVETTVVSTVEGLDVGKGERRRVGSEYLLGCDGAKSTVRKELGVTTSGEAPRRTNLGVVFRAPHLSERHTHGPAVHYWTINETVQGFVRPLDLDGRWWANIADVGDVDEVDADALIGAMIGGEADYSVISVDPWSPAIMLVDELRVDRIFLAGDAAHLNPPWGGHGYNTGVGDAIDIGWKLAAVLNGWGGPGLLDSYDLERRGVQEAVIGVAADNMDASPATLASSVPDDETVESADEPYAELAERIRADKKLEFHSLGLVLGSRYADSPIVIEEGGEPPPSSVTSFVPTSFPGARLPHAWLDAEDETSIYDVLGPEFTLLRLDSSLDISPLAEAAEELAVPLSVVDVDPDTVSYEYEAPLFLVRPDQHVAWRGDRVPENPRDVLERVCGR